MMKNHTGDIRHIIVRRGHLQELMIVLFTNSLCSLIQEIVTDIQKNFRGRQCHSKH